MSLHKRAATALGLVLFVAALPLACSDTAAPAGPVFECQLASGSESPEFLQVIGCNGDFQALASEPLRADLPGARSVKVVLDQADDNALYFQNSVLYKIHYEFASKHLSGNDLPLVPELSSFNATEYYTPDRRFLLGAVTYYEGPKVWALEIAPYDTASAAMITTLYETVAKSAYFGGNLFFHPTSDAVAVEADKLGTDVPVKTTDELYAAIDYQPLSLGSSMGRLRFLKAADLDTEYVSHEDIVVLDEAPNDISVIQGLVTEEFQTPLSHVNVLSQNRGTPNMGLRHAMTNPTLRGLEGKLVELTVGASTWGVREVTLEEAQAFWDAHKPEPVVLPTLDLSVTGLWNLEDVTPEPAAGASLRDAIKKSVLAFGGKAAHYSILVRTEDVPIQKAFAIPVHYYDQFMKQNGFYDQIDALLADPTFQADAAVRDQKLADLRKAMEAAPVDAAFQELLKEKIAAEYGTHKMRFRTSTNSEDLEGFPCAGCYESHTGDPTDWPDVLDAIRETYASAWLFRTFEERSYYGIDHKSIGMALLVHHNFPDEEANGVAVTANPFDEAGVDPAFYVNVQYGGDVEVVAPPPGVTSDQFLYYFTQPNQPITYLTHSSLLAEGERVLTTAQIHQLGVALDAIHARFSPAYGPAAGNKGWYAMDIEFKFDDEAAPGETPTLYIKQARPYPGRGDE
ncbi:PEP/pyruvate-binding domain-containing protein [Polyangium sp. 15x6]|uniref:PEP/pyruvate-binding domain-containing protein n=1 Tax=Polyangium sp. 15x6 TaxID=3042687 RepID=UPI00249B9BE1|nr:PEP/pyruvate-binding domain-containing protein [Polyangium sp. 15x6]MDI3284484.1 PEP/pyruvate-binding domain-containing protein [Polyangium sp. 15x6]